MHFISIYPINIELSLSTENNKIECGRFFPILFETLLVIEKVRNDFDKQSEPYDGNLPFQSMILVYVYKNVISLDYENHE